MDVNQYKELVSKVTKVPDISTTIWAKESKLCMMYIEFRNMEIIRDNLNNVCNVYGGGDTALTIVYSGDNEKIVHETTKDWTNVTYMKLYDHNVLVDEYCRLLTSYDFWDKFSAFDHVLTNSWDSYIFRRIPDKFFKYDIVGGPCRHFYTKYHNQIINICGDGCTCPRCEKGDHPFKEQNFITNPDNFFMFNGGFYLRKIESVKTLCKNKKWNGEPDDVYFALSDLVRPSRIEAQEFGVQDFKYDGIPVGCHQIWIKHEEYYVRNLFREFKFGKIIGRFYLKQDLGLSDDDTPDLVTISELIETYPMWTKWVEELPEKRKQLFTMFETSDVHPDIIQSMKVFDRVIVPYEYLKDILVRHGVNCVALNWYTSPLIRHKPTVVQKKQDPDKLVFLYVGTNDIRKNLITLTSMFCNLKHKLLVKTNHTKDLPESPNIKYITKRLSLGEMAGLYNMCDYVISFTRGEGVGLPMLEAKYFGKPVISHDGGVLSTLKDDSWIVLPSKETAIDHTNVPPFLQKVFHGTWWEIDQVATQKIVSFKKMKIYYRLSDKGRRNGKPDFINLENCLRNFCQHFSTDTITIIADNCEDNTIETISKYIEPKNIMRTSLGNSGAFLFAAKMAIEENPDDTIVYLVEDDYLHLVDSEKILKEGFSYGHYVSLYDHPDKYMDGGWPNPHVFGGGEETKVFLTPSTHWKYTNSTTMTFAVRVKTLREDIELMEKYCKDNIPGDFHMFCDLLGKGRKLLTPIPGRSTHGQMPWFCPLAEWHKQ